jgi:tetratricopeptide (TPR) repeat protein
MRYWFLFLLLASGLMVSAQSAPNASSNLPNSPSASSTETQSSQSQQSSQPSSTAEKPDKSQAQTPTGSGSVNADSLEDVPGDSSSKDSQIDISPPPNDAKTHPNSSDAVMNAELGTGGADVSQFHPWDPHKAAKDVEVGDFYFRLKNYRAAEDRYREALLYKDNDAMATFRLAICLEKMDRPDDARRYYENYLKILPHGPEAEKVKKAIGRLKSANNHGDNAK